MVKALTEQGVEGVTIGLVSNVKTRLSQAKPASKGKRKRVRRQRQQRQVAAQTASFTADELVSVQNVVSQFGSKAAGNHHEATMRFDPQNPDNKASIGQGLEIKFVHHDDFDEGGIGIRPYKALPLEEPTHYSDDEIPF